MKLDILVAGTSATASVGVYDRTPGVFVTTDNRDGTATVWATGLGEVQAAGELFETVWQPRVEINGSDAAVLYQINVRLPAGATAPFDVRLRE